MDMDEFFHLHYIGTAESRQESFTEIGKTWYTMREYTRAEQERPE